MDRLRHILAAVDFSPCSEAALCQAVRIAGWGSTVLRVLHVVDVPALAATQPALVPWPMPTQQDLVAEARARWSDFAKDLPGRDRLALDVAVGNPRDEIFRHAAEQQADLLVLGAHSVADAPRGIGTTAAACARRGRTRVLLIQPDTKGPFRRVCACVDFSATSLSAIEQAIRVAAQDDAALDIIHVHDDPYRGLQPPEQIRANMPDFDAKFTAAVIQRLKDFSAPFQHELGALKPSFHAVRHTTRWQGHGSGIVRFATEHRADLCVIGARSNWSVRDAVMGSTAERVLRDAGCCVLTVRPPEPA
jgi:universal stress protein E